MADFTKLKHHHIAGQSQNFQTHAFERSGTDLFLGYILSPAYSTDGAVLLKTPTTLASVSACKKLTHGLYKIAIQWIHPDGEYLYISGIRIFGVSYEPLIFRVKQSDLSITHAKRLTVGVNGQGVVVAKDGDGTDCMYSAARKTAIASANYIWKLYASDLSENTGSSIWEVKDIKHIFKFWVDEANDNDLYAIGESNYVAASYASVNKITQGTGGALTSQSCLRIGNSSCGTMLGTGAWFVSYYIDGDYIWCLGNIPKVTGDNGDVLLCKIQKTDTANDNKLKLVAAYRINNTTPDAFRGAGLYVDATNIYISTGAIPHSGLGSDEYGTPQCTTHLKITKTSMALVWARTLAKPSGDSWGGWTGCNNLLCDGSYLYSSMGTDIGGVSGYWDSTIAKIDMAAGDLADVLYGDNARVKEFDDSANITITDILSSLTVDLSVTDITLASDSTESYTGYTWADYVPTTATYDIEDATLLTTLNPDGANTLESPLAASSGNYYDVLADDVAANFVQMTGDKNTWRSVICSMSDIATAISDNNRPLKVTVSITAEDDRSVSGDVDCRTILQVDTDTIQYGTTETIEDKDTWHTYSTEYSKDPDGNDWTWANINKLNCGCDLWGKQYSFYISWPTVTKVWVTVTYEPYQAYDVSGTGGLKLGGTSLISAVALSGSIINQFQKANLGTDLFNGSLI